MATLNPIHPYHQHYRRFCQQPIVELTIEVPALAICGVGYQNKNRSLGKNAELCKSHFLSKLSRERQLGRYKR